MRSGSAPAVLKSEGALDERRAHCQTLWNAWLGGFAAAALLCSADFATRALLADQHCAPHARAFSGGASMCAPTQTVRARRPHPAGSGAQSGDPASTGRPSTTRRARARPRIHTGMASTKHQGALLPKEQPEICTKPTLNLKFL